MPRMNFVRRPSSGSTSLRIDPFASLGGSNPVTATNDILAELAARGIDPQSMGISVPRATLPIRIERVFLKRPTVSNLLVRSLQVMRVADSVAVTVFDLDDTTELFAEPRLVVPVGHILRIAFLRSGVSAWRFTGYVDWTQEWSS